MFFKNWAILLEKYSNLYELCPTCTFYKVNKITHCHEIFRIMLSKFFFIPNHFLTDCSLNNYYNRKQEMPLRIYVLDKTVERQESRPFL